MNTSGIGSDLVWVYLDGGVWWPGALRQRSDLFQSSLADLRIVDLFGTNEAIAVDTSNSHTVHQYDTRLSPQSFLELHETQTIAENMQELYSCGLSHLRIRIDAMIDCEISKDECTTTVANVCAKRKDVILWDDYFLAVAFLSAMRSKDPSTQVGACIVNSRNRIVGIGYNGFPRGCSDDILPWAREAEDSLDTKYPYVCHAEVNAILNKNSADLENCKLYVALFPCNECAKMIIQSGITEIVYLSDKYRHTNSMRASRRMLDMAGVVLRQYTPEKGSISVNFRAIDKPPITLSEK